MISKPWAPRYPTIFSMRMGPPDVPMFPPPLSAPYLASPRLDWLHRANAAAPWAQEGDKGIQLASAALLAAPYSVHTYLHTYIIADGR